MEINCTQENLARGIATAMRAVQPRGTLPITSHLLLETDEGMLKITGTDLSTLISTWVHCDVATAGAVTVPARLFQEYVNSVAATDVALNKDPQASVLNVIAGRSNTRINGGMAQEFPPAPNLASDETLRTFSIPVADLRAAIQRVAVAAATEESRPVLTGVQIQVKDGQFTMAAADGFRLAVHTIPTPISSSEGEEPPSLEADLIIPAKSMNELSRLLASADDTLEMSAALHRGSVMFLINSPQRTQFFSTLIQGTFPAWDNLVPQNHEAAFSVDSATLMRAVRTAAIFAQDGSNIVRMSYGFTPMGRPLLNISANSEELGQNLESLPLTELEGEPGNIAFNHHYLREAINCTGPGIITLKATNPSSPGMLTPKDSENTLHVVMPMFVQWDNYNHPFADDPLEYSIADAPPDFHGDGQEFQDTAAADPGAEGDYQEFQETPAAEAAANGAIASQPEETLPEDPAQHPEQEDGHRETDEDGVAFDHTQADPVYHENSSRDGVYDEAQAEPLEELEPATSEPF